MVNLLKSLQGVTARIIFDNGIIADVQIGAVVSNYVICTAPAIPGVKFYIVIDKIASVN